MVVVSPDVAAVDQTIALVERLRASGMSIGALVVNRVHGKPVAGGRLPQDLSGLAALRDVPGKDVAAAADAMRQTCAELGVLARADGLQVERLRATLVGTQIATVPLLEADVHDLEGLALVTQLLMGG